MDDGYAPASPLDDFESFTVRPPHPQLAGHVLLYLGKLRQGAQPMRRWMTARDSVMVVIDLETPARLDYGPSPGSPTSVAVSPVVGPSDQPTMFEQVGREHGITVELTPRGAYALFGVPLTELTNTTIGLADLLGARARRLTEQLTATRGWEARFHLLDVTLAAWMLNGPQLADPVGGAWQYLVNSGGRTRISELADKTGWTRQHLHARFRSQIGLSPKTVARLARLHTALRLITRPQPQRLSDVAVSCGYSDQAHLNLDFRALIGYAPTEFLTLDGSGGEIVTGSRLDMALWTPPRCALTGSTPETAGR